MTRHMWDSHGSELLGSLWGKLTRSWEEEKQIPGPVVSTHSQAGQMLHTHHGLAPKTAPVLQAQHAATSLVTHNALGTHRQISFQPLVGHGNL